MADIRELIILSPDVLDPKPQKGVMRLLLDVRMAVRRAVVWSSRYRVLKRLYLSVYRAHLWIAAQLGKRFAGTDVVFLTSGMATGDVQIGISDVDLAIYGSWPEERQFRLMKIFGAMALFSPLFDKRSIGSIGTVEDLRHLCATDMTYAITHARGRLQWKVLYGENVLLTLPPIARERFAGCVYMEFRRWWSNMADCAFGNEVLARDGIFRNTVCFKSAAELLRAERMLSAGEVDATSRRRLLQEEAEGSGDPVVQMLLDCADTDFLQARGDLREPTLGWFLERAERMHAGLAEAPGFTSVGSVRREGTAEERLIAPQTLAHAERLVKLAETHWSSLRAAYLTPCASMFSPDSMALLLEPDAGLWPTRMQVREVMAMHFGVALPQRLAVYLLLPKAAYQLDATGALEFFHYTLTPRTSPDVFSALAEPEYLVFGEVRVTGELPCWSGVAQELMLEELNARRGACARFGLSSRPSAIENQRNLWRLLALLVMERSLAEGDLVVPTTVGSIRRGFAKFYPAVAKELEQLERDFLEARLTKEASSGALQQRMESVYANFAKV